jgi:predicted nucleic acid-binding protein
MNARLVIDASAVIAIVRSEPERDVLEQLLEARKRSGVTLLAPSGFWLEVVNSLVRRHRLSSAEVLEIVREIDTFGIRMVDLGRPLLVLTLDLAERYGLTAYDAGYLALALAEDADLLTLDRDLVYAAGDRAISPDDWPRLSETPAVYEHDVTWPNYKEASAYLAQLRADAMTGGAT